MQITSTTGVQFSGSMPGIYGSSRLSDLNMQRSHDLHMSVAPTPHIPDRVGESFANLLNEAVSKVENLDVNAHRLTHKAIYEPEKVDVHNVVIAAEKARFALNLTKTIADGVVRGFRELTQPR